MSTLYTLKDVKRQACTMLLPTAHLEQMKVISLRTGIPRNTLTALALDEYLQRHYVAQAARLADANACDDDGDSLEAHSERGQ